MADVELRIIEVDMGKRYVLRLKTCDHSEHPDRMWCSQRNRTTVGVYCGRCPLYENSEAGVAA